MHTKRQRSIQPGLYFLVSVLLVLLLSQCRSNTPTPGQPSGAISTSSPTPTASRTITTITTQTRTPAGPARTTLTPTATNSVRTNPVPRYQRVGEMGKGILPQIVRSPDGKTVLVNDGFTLRVLNAADYSEVGSMDFGMQDPDGHIFVYSPDSRYVIVSAGYFGFQVIDVATLKSLGTGSGGNGFFTGTIFTPDSQHVLWLMTDRSSGGPYHSICRLDYLLGENAENPTNDWGYNCYPVEDDDDYHTLSAPAISPNGSLVAAGFSNWRHNFLYIWDFQSKAIRFKIPEQPAEINSVAFSPDGQTLATGGNDGVIRLWNPETGTVRRTVNAFLDSVTDVEFTPDGRSLRVEVASQPAVLYDLASGKTRPADQTTSSPINEPIAAQMLNEGYLVAGGSSKIVFSQDGSTVAVAHGSIQIWDVATRELKNTIFTPTSLRLTGMTFSPNGQRLAVITDAGDVLSWDVVTGQTELNLTAQGLAAGQAALYAISSGMGPTITAGVIDERGIVFSPDSAEVALGNGSAVEIWNIASGTKGRSLDPLDPAAFPTRLSYSADGKHVFAILNRNRDAAVWDAVSGKLVRRLNLPHVDANAFSSVSLYQNWFARNNYDDQEYWIELWDLEQGKMVKLPMPKRETEPLRFSTDGRFLMAIVDDRIYLWRVSTGQLVLVTEDEFDIGDLALSPDGKTLVTASYGKITLWDVGAATSAAMSDHFTPPAPPPTETPYFTENVYPTRTPQPTMEITPIPGVEVQTGAISVSNASQIQQQARFGMGQLAQMTWEGNQINVTGAQGIIRYAASSLQEAARVEIDEVWVTSSRALPDGRVLLAGNTKEGKVQLWAASGTKLESKKMLLEISGSSPTAISPNGKWFIFSTDDGLATRNVETGEEGIFLHDYWYTPQELLFSPDGKLLAASRSDRSIRIYDFATGSIANGVGGPEDSITQMSFNKENNLLVGAAGGSAWVWSVVPGLNPLKVSFYEGQDFGNLVLFENAVTAVALNHDSKVQAIGSSESHIWLYDRVSKEVIGKLNGHNSAPIEMAFSPDGDQLASIDRDGELIVWDLARGVIVNRVRPETGAVRGLIVREDSSVSAWGENTIWQLDKNTANPQHITGVPGGLIIGVSGADDLAATYRPYQVSLYDAGTGKFLQTLPDEAVEPWVEHYWEGLIFRGFNSAVFSTDGSRLATVGSGGIWIYDLPGAKLLRHFKGNWSMKAAISPDGNWIVASTHEKSSPPELLKLDTGQSILITGIEDNYARGDSYPQYVFSKDMRYIAAVNNEWEEPSRLIMFNSANGHVERELAFEKVYLTSLALNANASIAAIGLDDGTIKLIDLEQMKEVAVLAGHKGGVSTLAFSNDGKLLYSVGREGVVMIWGIP